MKQKNMIVGLMFLMTIFVNNIWAQSSAVAAGGDASGTGGSVSYSVGQLVTNTTFGTDITISEGVQQPYEISVVTGIKGAEGINLEFQVYPNPTSDFLLLKIENSEFNDLSFSLFDISGKLILSGRLFDAVTQIDMSMLPPAVYALKVMSENTLIKDFKILKF